MCLVTSLRAAALSLLFLPLHQLVSQHLLQLRSNIGLGPRFGAAHTSAIAGAPFLTQFI
jgi:hypothetical protein